MEFTVSELETVDRYLEYMRYSSRSTIRVELKKQMAIIQTLMPLAEKAYGVYFETVYGNHEILGWKEQSPVSRQGWVTVVEAITSATEVE